LSGPIRLGPSAAIKEKRLAALLAQAGPAGRGWAEAVEDAQLLGSLALSGIAADAAEIAAARAGQPAPQAVAGLYRAARAVSAEAPFSGAALLAWHREAVGGGRLRSSERARAQGPPPAPAAFVAGRVEIVAQWLAAESAGEMRPAQQGALLLARLIEILPFEHGNGRVARLAASHVMVRAGARPPILTAADAARLEESLAAAHQLATEPLVALLEHASERALDVAIAALAAPRREL
jgi:Fic family protein